MSEPLRNARHEAFALAIANGHKLERAHELAGFKPDRKTAWSLRHRPDVTRRVEEILKCRVEADSRSFARRQKSKDNVLQRALKELEAIAFQDVREVAAWRREPVVNPDGEVTGYLDALAIRDSADLTPEAAKAIKTVFTKSGAIRIDMHDKRQALVDLVKLLSGSDAQPTGNVTVNQINVGQTDALEAAKRVSFLLAAARAKQPTAPMLDATAQASTEAGAKPRP